MAKTLFDKIWEKHIVTELDDGNTLLYIDRHLVHEVTSPQAFEGLRMAGQDSSAGIDLLDDGSQRGDYG